MEYVGIIDRSGTSCKYELPKSRIIINPGLCLIPKIRNSLPFIYEPWTFSNKNVIRFNTRKLYSSFCIKANFAFGKECACRGFPAKFRPFHQYGST